MRPQLLALPLLAYACSSDPAGVRELPIDLERVIPTLEGEVSVVRAEMSVPHIYAKSMLDLHRVQGFITAQDRYVQIELTRRFGAGTLSEVLGELGVPIDAQARAQGMREVSDRTWAQANPELKARFEAFAEGINAYINTVKRRQLPVPEEIEIVGGLLDLSDATEAMQPMTGFDIAAVAAVLMSRLGYETSDMARAQNAAALEVAFADGLNGMGGAKEMLRARGIFDDVFYAVRPVNMYTQTSPGQTMFKLSKRSLRAAPTTVRNAQKTGVDLLRLINRILKFDGLLQRPRGVDFGSNAWALTSGATGSGAILANDGHLPLTVPSLFYQMCLDTKYFGDEDYQVCGLFFPGLPLLAVGTNGHVAWGQTYLDGDVTDWFNETLILGQDGLPAATVFQGSERPLQRIDEVYRVPSGDSFEEVTIPRWMTFDGRWLVSFEGTVVESPEGIFSFGEYVEPSDTNGDDVINAVSFDWTALDMGRTLQAVDGFSRSRTVGEFAEHTKKLVGYAQNIIVADGEGDIMYTAFNALPCRTALERDNDGRFLPGQNPRFLLDGTQVGGFEIPLTETGEVDETGCVVPFAAGPRAISPAPGYVLTANHDPLGNSLDGLLGNDEVYIGGAWSLGMRAKTIDDQLAMLSSKGEVTIDDMAALQADHRSPMGLLLAPVLVETIARAKALQMPMDESEMRLLTMYEQNAARVDEVESRLSTWLSRGGLAVSGVDTFYKSYEADDREDAVATMLFNAWLRQLPRAVFNDEGADEAFAVDAARVTFRALFSLLFGRGEGNPMALSSFDPQTMESVLFDDVSTEFVERSDEVLLGALVAALDALSSEDAGFGTGDMNAWLWGLKHQVRFVPLLEEVGASNPLVGLIAFKFGLTTDLLPLLESIPADDPRAALVDFPRDGDFFSVDAASPGLSGDSYSYSAGPVMRMVIQLNGKEVLGQNILPGGQSGLLGSEHFGDQAALWLGNKTIPLRYTVEEAVEGAVTSERFVPSR